jgi:DNA-directed RNA polymerase specialized sigma subunit
MTAKEELQNCRNAIIESEIIDEIIKRKMAKLDLQAMILSDMPASRSCNRDKILNTIASTEMLELLKHRDIIDLTYEKIEKVTDSRCRIILKMRYIQCRSWVYIARKLNASESLVHKLHSRGLSLYENIQFDRH